MSIFSNALYRHSPPWLQETYIAALVLARNALREGGRFKKEFAEVMRTQGLSEAEMQWYQLERTRALVQHAVKHVPYYQDLFRKNNLRTEDIEGLEDIIKIPLLGKQDVVKAGRSMLSTNYRGIKYKGATSGTTGLSMVGFRELNTIIRENAFLWRQLVWAGFQMGQRRAWIRGDMVAPAAQQHAPFWRLNRIDNMLMMSSFHLSEPNAESYIHTLEKFDPIMIQAYPSSISYLARYLESHGRKYYGRALKSVVTSSETLHDDQRRTIERVMDCRVYDRYGCFEQVASIGTCEHGTYHIMSDYGLIELLPQDDGTAEIVGTGFDNFLMPLIRYRTGDSVVPMEPEYRCPCGRSFPVIKRVLGRMDEAIRTPDGRQIAMMVNMFDGLENVWQGQVVQDTPDTIRVLVVPMRGMDKRERDDLVKRARSLVGPEMKIAVEEVGEIARTRSGKLRAVVCNIR
jgi:phenylacetate-CoA ligase